MKKKILIIGSIILVAIAIICAIILSKDDKESAPLSNETLTANNLVVNLDDKGNPRHISGKFSEVLVVDANTALESLNDVKKMLKIENVYDEFYLKEMTSFDNVVYYELQQKHKNVDVLGGEITISADKEGNVLGINAQYIPDVDTTLSGVKSEREIKEILTDKYGVDTEYVNIHKYIYAGENDIVVYLVDLVCSTGVYEITINAKDGSIIFEDDLLNNVAYTYTGPGANDVEHTITLNETFEKRYEFHDKDRNIIITDARGMGIESLTNLAWMTLWSSSTPFTAGMDENGILTYGANNENAKKFLKSIVTTMDNMEDIYDYYNSVLGIKSYDNKGSNIVIHFGIYENFDILMQGNYYKNASWHPIMKQFYIGAYNDMFLSIGKDVVAHEFTHAVVQHTANFKDYNAIDTNVPNYSGSLNEAYADILGSLIEGENWTIGEVFGEDNIIRDLTNPGKYNKPKEVGGEYFYPTLEEGQTLQEFLTSKGYESLYDYDDAGEHHNSTVVSHAAYLMYNSGAFKDREEMAKVWYNSLLLLSSYSTFEDCAYAVIQSATNLGLSSNSIDKIKQAFYDTKMLSSEYYNLAGKVIDKESKEPLKEVTVTAINKLNAHVNFKMYTNQDGKYGFQELPMGDYELVFEFPKYTSSSKEVELNEDKENINISLEKIDEVNSEQSEVVFVMDISASMDDNDPTEIRKQIIVNILGSMDDKSKAALVTFAKNGETVSDGLSEQEIDKKIIMTDVFNISNVDGFSSNAGTNGKAGLEVALKLFDENSKTRKYIVFLTDGQDTVYSYDVTYEQLIEKAKDNDIRIFTIGLSEKVDDEYLKKIADETDGKYYHADSSTNLYDFDAQIFAEIE